ncbi:hypothetical protein GWK47_050026 [Chionoecetes opilio]|uniref:Uncharacterized protein n=1 Tax=Chionoecetes opilio TaxID=41210 RepID=A0A8J5CT13_CHIOP|nr:hypothetical protein GWK47_050026 [Chionoecetes opilio]
MAVRDGARHGKSGARVARGCFLLVVFLLPLLNEAHGFSARRPALVWRNFGAKWRGKRSTFMHPTVTSFSPPNKNPTRRRQPSQHPGTGSSSTSFLPPGVVSRAPATRAQVPSPGGPAITPPPHTPRTHTWVQGGASRPPQPTVIGFGPDRGTPMRPAKWSRPQGSLTHSDGGGGWAGRNTPAVYGHWEPPQHIPDPPDAASPFGRDDTFGHTLSEDLSHRHHESSGRRQTEADRSPISGRVREGGSGGSRTVFNGGSRQPHIWHIQEESENAREANDENERRLLDINATSEYQPDDYNFYHEYDQIKPTWRVPEQTPPPVHNLSILTSQHVMEIHNLTSQADLHALLEQIGVTFEELQDFLNTGAQKKDILKYLAPPNPSTTIATSTSLPVLPHPPSVFDVSIVEEGYQHDVTRQVSLPAIDTKTGGNDTEESKEQARKNRKKGRRPGGKRRKNRRRKGKKGQREGGSDLGNATQTPAPDPWVPGSPTTAGTKGILLTTTQPLMPDAMNTSTSPVRNSDVSIVSVTLVEAPSDPKPNTPLHTTFTEKPPPKGQDTHTTPTLWEERKPLKIPRPKKPSETEQTVNEVEKVNFVREKQRDDYVFPLRGLLIISGLMGALAVFTLVVLISYAVIKCSKKPVVNNYQVSEQQKPAGT